MRQPPAQGGKKVNASTPMTVGAARSIFGSHARARLIDHDLQRESLPTAVRAFYADRVAIGVLLLCGLVVGYGGGAVMFWFHSIYLNEGGPAISPWLHWFIDSTAGFIGLTPALAIVLPATAWLAARGTSPIGSLRYAVVAGTLLALLAAPAPIIHDEFIGRGTWMAQQMTELWGHSHQPTGRKQEVSVVVAIEQQVAVGIPIYVAVLWLTVMSSRFVTRLARRPAKPG